MATPILSEEQRTAEGAPLLLRPGATAAFLGISRRGFFELKKQPGFPTPVEVPGFVQRYYRTSDVVRWVASLRPGDEQATP